MTQRFVYEIKRSRAGRPLQYTSRGEALRVLKQILIDWEMGLGAGKLTLTLHRVTQEAGA